MTGRSVINICFHGIGSPARELEPGESRYWISRPQFESILDAVADWTSARISFDDGNLSDVQFGLPALRQRGLTATFFPLAGRIGAAGSVDREGIEELVAAGMTIGSHGMDHLPWRGLDAAGIERELVLARQKLAEIAGTRVDQAALPLGRYDRRVLQNLKNLGYLRVHTSDRRPAHSDAWLQPRFSVRDDDTAQSVQLAVDSASAPIQRARLSAVGIVKRFR